MPPGFAVIRSETQSSEIENDVELNNANRHDQAVNASIDVIIVPDGGYGWVVVVASFFMHIFVLGNIYSFGVFFPIYIDVFHANQASVAWVGSMGAGLLTGLGAYSGAWADRYGNSYIVFTGSLFIGAGYFLASFSNELWHLYLTQGFLAGVGYSLSFISGVSVVGQWFSKNRGLAVGIAVAGSGLGQFAMSMVTNALIVANGWRSTLRYLALINIIGLILCSLAIRRLLPCKTATESPSSMHYFHQKNFTLLYIGCFLATLGIFMPYTHLPQYALLHGITKGKAVWLLSIMGICSAVGRVAVGYAADRVGKLQMIKLCMFAGGISTLCWMVCTQYYAMAIYGAVFGFFAGGVISLMPAVSADQFGMANIGSVMGLLYTSTAVGNLLSTPIAGFLHDAYHSYYPPISVAGTFMLMGCATLFFMDRQSEYQKSLLVNDEGTITGELSTKGHHLLVYDTEPPAVPQEDDDEKQHQQQESNNNNDNDDDDDEEQLLQQLQHLQQRELDEENKNMGCDDTRIEIIVDE